MKHHLEADFLNGEIERARCCRELQNVLVGGDRDGFGLIGGPAMHEDALASVRCRVGQPWHTIDVAHPRPVDCRLRCPARAGLGFHLLALDVRWNCFAPGIGPGQDRPLGIACVVDGHAHEFTRIDR
jgi:hypothetical protein